MRQQHSDRPIQSAYFPESGVASVVAVSKGRAAQAEVALIGREGMTGLPIVHGTDRSPCDIFMQVAGEGQEISADDLRAAIVRSPTMRNCFLLYAHAFAVQCSYSALANARGNLQERLARWLLMAQDRIQADELELTHEFLALMLGVRRAGVTIALHQLDSKGLISMARGVVFVRDRAGLEEAAVGFYGQPEAEFERVLGREVVELRTACFITP